MTQNLDHLTDAQIALLIERIPDLPLQEKLELLEQLEQHDTKNARRRAREDFLTFCHRVYPGFKEGPHHRNMAPLLQDMARPNGYTWDTADGRPPKHALRLTVSMAPRFGKSETIAYLYVAWYLGHNPKHQIMMVTHTEELSASFGKKVRDLIDTPEYQAIFDGACVVSKDKSAAGNWNTTAGGVYLALGVGGNAAGKGADLLVLDDLVSEQAVLYGNPETAFEQAWNYVQVGPLQRLMPGGRIVMIGCMTAETRVLMADGSEKELQHVKVGDEIATYDAGRIGTSRVTNWIKHRDDTVYKIVTSSGKMVRANKRHPFLVDRAGVRSWVRVRDLRVGDRLVETAPDQSKPKGCAPSATSASCAQTAGSARSPATGIGGSGAALSAAPKGAGSRSSATGCATPATAKRTGLLASAGRRLSKSAKAICDIATASLQRITTACWLRKAAFALSAGCPPPKKTPVLGSSPSCTSIIATIPSASAGCCVTTATSQSGTPSPKPCSWPLPHTYAVTTAPIVEIVEDGFEPVFDMEVARTENFIANGVVSHNTRWGKRDPIARAVQWSKENPAALPWHEIRFPAVMEVERDGEMKTISLWPEQWPVHELLAKKANMLPQYWAAQYMQNPTADEGALIKREQWKIWPLSKPPEVNYVIQTWDTAHEQKSKSDYSASITWGIFFNEQTERNEIMMLDRFNERVTFPQLKKAAFERNKEREPEETIIEKKAAGAPLIQEMRAQGMFITEINPSRGARGMSNDKYARVNAITPIFTDGCVWAPDTRWAREVMEQCAEFPNGEHDDLVDNVEMALSRYRRGGFIRLSDDERDDDNAGKPRRKAYY